MTFTPPLAYRMWWRIVEACSGIPGDFDALRWSVVPGARIVRVSGADSVAASFFPNDNRILLAEQSMYDGQVVRHEMLHALLGPMGHSPRFFRDACGGIVNCGGSCAVEAPPLADPPNASVEIPTTELTYTLAVWPTVYTQGESGGRAVIIMTAHNGRAAPVWVRISSDTGLTPRWSYTSSIPGVGDAATAGPNHVGFLAGETKRVSFDVNVDGVQAHLASGVYNFSGRFGFQDIGTATMRVP